MNDRKKKRTALVLSGAVAKGPYHAGVIEALMDLGVELHAVVGTSAGALTAALLGAGLTVGRGDYVAEEIVRLWLDKAAWQEFAAVSGRSLLKIQGLFRSDRVRELLRSGLDRVLLDPPDRIHRVPVTLVATDLNGKTDPDNPLRTPRTTYEWPLRFEAADYLDLDRRARLTTAATASATFPGLFAPEFIDEIPCVDGGAVNNAPLSYAIEEPGIERILVVSPQPPRPPPPTTLGGFDLLGHIVDILINERLHRDLQLAHRINARLQLIERELADLPDEKRAAIRRALDWRPVEIVEVCPTEALPGNALTGFWDKDARSRYHEAGYRRATEVLTAPSPAAEGVSG